MEEKKIVFIYIPLNVKPIKTLFTWKSLFIIQFIPKFLGLIAQGSKKNLGAISTKTFSLKHFRKQCLKGKTFQNVPTEQGMVWQNNIDIDALSFYL